MCLCVRETHALIAICDVNLPVSGSFFVCLFGSIVIVHNYGVHFPLQGIKNFLTEADPHVFHLSLLLFIYL